uniref:Uncharacterized protein n=1 Tax=Rhizophagus irregularis (strain DAOM 181602 / DAOM 197198 / MUCL 43194) TaxID=747089 RepID=U9T6G2_RHIID
MEQNYDQKIQIKALLFFKHNSKVYFLLVYYRNLRTSKYWTQLYYFMRCANELELTRYAGEREYGFWLGGQSFNVNEVTKTLKLIPKVIRKLKKYKICITIG